MNNSGEDIKLANRENGPNALKINDPELLSTLRDLILRHWEVKDERDFFPAPQPVSLERRDLYKLKEYEYLVCAKSDGMRFLLVLYAGVTYMVDRAFKFYKVNVHFKNKELYKEEPYDHQLGGIFDGELVMNKKEKWQYVIHDCINIHGKDMSKNIFHVRHAEIIKLVSDYWVSENSEFRITSKQFFPFKQLYLLNKLIIEDKLDHKTDGIICTPANKKIGIHTQYDLFKWKPRHLHTFDFKIIKDSEQGIVAYVNKNGTHIKYACAPPNTDEEKKFLDALSKNCPEFFNNCIVECEYIDDNYIPVKIRLDKTHPNSLFTVRKTLCNIKENITIEELIELSKD
jgi:hypothetical protein